ncbi:unnamed protein product, partial [Timema podura]|nr:unnamed protein product [Timema podura]
MTSPGNTQDEFNNADHSVNFVTVRYVNDPQEGVVMSPGKFNGWFFLNQSISQSSSIRKQDISTVLPSVANNGHLDFIISYIIKYYKDITNSHIEFPTISDMSGPIKTFRNMLEHIENGTKCTKLH